MLFLSRVNFFSSRVFNLECEIKYPSCSKKQPCAYSEEKYVFPQKKCDSCFEYDRYYIVIKEFDKNSLTLTCKIEDLFTAFCLPLLQLIGQNTTTQPSNLSLMPNSVSIGISHSIKIGP